MRATKFYFFSINTYCLYSANLTQEMGGVEIEDCVTMAQFNELRQSMEEKQDRLTQDLQALLTEIRGRHQPHDGASNHGEDGEDSDGRATARRAREQVRRNQGAAHGRGRGRG